MASANDRTSELLDRLIPLLLKLPWMEIFAELWKISRKLWQGMPDEGIYEVLQHEATLELLDKKGRRARVGKRQRVRYLQNDIIAYQDQAWGDGKILLNYSCSPGKLVDRWRPGQETQLLISLRDTKRRGDTDDYHITWNVRDGYLRKKELWETEVSHKTQRLALTVVFPKGRPPQRMWIVEAIQRRRRVLDNNVRDFMSDGRCRVQWQTTKPRLNERYQLQWEW